jgi:hypothetical protein
MRLGGVAVLHDGFFLMAGLSGGYDSSEYVSAGIDLGLYAMLWDRLKINVMYIYSYSWPASGDAAASTDQKPQMETLDGVAASSGTAYNAHRVIINASYRFL